MAEPSEREIELYKRMVTQEVADNVESMFKRKFAILTIVAAIVSAVGGGGVVYQALSHTIVEKQNDAVSAIQKATALTDALRETLFKTVATLDKATQDQEKLKADAEDARNLIAEARGQFDASRTQVAEAQMKSARSLEDLIAVLRVQSDTIKSLLGNAKVSDMLGGDVATKKNVEALDSVMQTGEAAVKQVREAAKNSRYTIFLHLSRNAAVPTSIENDIRSWLTSQGYVVGGVTRDNTTVPRLDYFNNDDEEMAKTIGDFIRTKYPTYYSGLQLRKPEIRNPVGYIGLWL